MASPSPGKTSNPSAVKAPSGRLVLSGTALSTLLILVHTTNDSFQAMLAALLPTLQQRFTLQEGTLALLVATLSFSSSVLQPVFGAIADRFGRRRVGALGVMVSSVVLSLIAVMPTLGLLFAALLLGGMGSAAFHPAGTTLARNAGGANKALTVSLFSAGGTLGLALGPAVILGLARTVGLAYSPLLMLPGLLLGGLMFAFAPSQPKAERKQSAAFFDLRLFLTPVGVLCAAGILRSVAFVTFNNAVPLWLVSQGVGKDSFVISLTLFLYAFFAGVGGVLAGALARRMSYQWLITGSMVVALPVYLLLLHTVPGSAAYYALVMSAGLLINAGLPLMIVAAQDLAPQAVGAASGLLMGFTWGVAGLLYIGVGYLQEVIGLAPAMQLSFWTLLPGALLSYLVLRRSKAATGAA